nr:MAG TPA: hypothetical protein [Caudoviricetes sp.]
MAQLMRSVICWGWNRGRRYLYRKRRNQHRADD